LRSACILLLFFTFAQMTTRPYFLAQTPADMLIPVRRTFPSPQPSFASAVDASLIPFLPFFAPLSHSPEVSEKDLAPPYFRLAFSKLAIIPFPFFLTQPHFLTFSLLSRSLDFCALPLPHGPELEKYFFPGPFHPSLLHFCRKLPSRVQVSFA